MCKTPLENTMLWFLLKGYHFLLCTDPSQFASNTMIKTRDNDHTDLASRDFPPLHLEAEWTFALINNYYSSIITINWIYHKLHSLASEDYCWIPTLQSSNWDYFSDGILLLRIIIIIILKPAFDCLKVCWKSLFERTL